MRRLRRKGEEGETDRGPGLREVECTLRSKDGARKDVVTTAALG